MDKFLPSPRWAKFLFGIFCFSCCLCLYIFDPQPPYRLMWAIFCMYIGFLVIVKILITKEHKHESLMITPKNGMIEISTVKK